MRLLLLAFLVVPLGLGASVANADDDLSAADAARAIDAVLASVDDRDPASGTRAVKALGRRAGDAYGALLEAGHRHACGTASGDVLERTVDGLGAKRLETHLRATLREADGDRARLAALGVLARFGGPDHLGLAVELIEGVDGTWLRTKRVRAAWEAAWSRVTDGSVTRREQRDALLAMPEALRGASARVLAERNDVAGLGAVVEAAASDPEASAALLGALGGTSRLLLYRAGAVDAVQAGLAARDPKVQKAAAGLAGRVRATEAVEALIVRLEDEDATVRAASIRALRAITGSAVGRDAPAWQRFAERARKRADAMERAWDDDARDVRTLSVRLQEVVREPFAATRLVPEIVQLLGHEEPAVARLAAATLGRMGALDAAPALAEVVEDADPGVAAAAQAALVQLTGERHEATTRAWQKALGA